MVKQLTKAQFERLLKFLKDDGRFRLKVSSDDLSKNYFFICQKGSATCLLTHFTDVNRYYVA